MSAVLRVVRGAPTDDEIAAVTVALLLSALGTPAPVPRPVGWGPRVRGYRPPGAWTSR